MLYRKIHVYHGDFNAKIDTNPPRVARLPRKQATFCLIDQRTFECHWETLQKLANYKKSNNKIELFTFWRTAGLSAPLPRRKTPKSCRRW